MPDRLSHSAEDFNVKRRKPKLIVLLDAGHGGIIDGQYQTKGKRSPKWDDGSQYFEGVGNRLIRDELAKLLDEEGIKYHYVNEGNEDISLQLRVDIANEFCDEYGSGNCLFISIHSNGFKKNIGEGWSCYTTEGPTNSDKFATALYEEAKKMWPNEKYREDDDDMDPDKEANYTVIMGTDCPSILSENFFHTHERECKRYLMSEQGRKEIAEVHFNMIKRFAY